MLIWQVTESDTNRSSSKHRILLMLPNRLRSPKFKMRQYNRLVWVLQGDYALQAQTRNLTQPRQTMVKRHGRPQQPRHVQIGCPPTNLLQIDRQVRRSRVRPSWISDQQWQHHKVLVQKAKLASWVLARWIAALQTRPQGLGCPVAWIGPRNKAPSQVTSAHQLRPSQERQFYRVVRMGQASGFIKVRVCPRLRTRTTYRRLKQAVQWRVPQRWISRRDNPLFQTLSYRRSAI